MPKNQIAVQNKGNLPVLKKMLDKNSIREQFEKALGNNSQATLFISSIIEVVSLDNKLRFCEPSDIVKECLKAATLRLPINKSLGYAWIIPYGKEKPKPQFQIGYKGLVQLAMRTGLYKYLNAGPVYEGEEVVEDRLYGVIRIEGKPTSDKAIGYFAVFQLKNGMEKGVYWPKDKVVNHARQYSKSWGMKDSAWVTNFDAMASKTVLAHLLSKWGIFSIEFLMAGVPLEDATGVIEGGDVAQKVENVELPVISCEQEPDNKQKQKDEKKDEKKEVEKKELKEKAEAKKTKIPINKEKPADKKAKKDNPPEKVAVAGEDIEVELDF